MVEEAVSWIRSAVVPLGAKVFPADVSKASVVVAAPGVIYVKVVVAAADCFRKKLDGFALAGVIEKNRNAVAAIAAATARIFPRCV